MQLMVGKKVVVVGGSRGVGRRIVELAAGTGAQVLAVARGAEGLESMAQAWPGVDTLALDAREADAPAKVFARSIPDVLVIGGGVFPPAAPLHELNWEAFAINWESDARIAFHFLKAALNRPLPAGSTIVLLSSGAGFTGSPNSGGYAAAKRAQIFMADYAQKESDRLGLGLSVLAIAPRIMPDTDLGRHAIAGYAHYLGMSEAEFAKGMVSPPSARDAAQAVINLLTKPAPGEGRVFIVTGTGLQDGAGLIGATPIRGDD